MREYPRYVTPDHVPFDPLILARETERIVCRGSARKYTAFYATGVYGGIATGYACGCCLRCVFCWVDWSRDFPEKYGEFYAAEEAARKIVEAARKYGVRKARISGSEPTIGKDHLLNLLGILSDEKCIELFILETNGILFGADRDYVRKVADYEKVHIRVSLKAGTPEAFSRKTGAKPESFELPFRAIEYLLEEGASFHVAAMSADPRIMGPDERLNLVKRLADIDPKLLLMLEEEVIDPYPTALKRLELAGLRLTWPLKEIYEPIKDTIKRLAGRRQ